MSTLLGLVTSLLARIPALAVKIGFPAALAFLSPLAPIITGIGQFIGALVTAVGEILAALSKSAEGRIALCLIAALAGFLYLRFHYIQEGKAIERAKISASLKPCPASRLERRSR
jgi:hypothetical protein